MSFQTWVVVLVGVWVTVAPISDDIYITSENGSNWGWIGCSPISDVSLICLFVRVYRHMARESLRITDSFTPFMSIDCPPKWFWTSFFRSPLFGSALFQGHFCRKKVWFSQSLVHLGGASYIDQVTAPSIEFWSRSKPPRADLDAWLLFLHEVGRRTVGSPSVLLPPGSLLGVCVWKAQW